VFSYSHHIIIRPITFFAGDAQGPFSVSTTFVQQMIYNFTSALLSFVFLEPASSPSVVASSSGTDYNWTVTNLEVCFLPAPFIGTLCASCKNATWFTAGNILVNFSVIAPSLTNATHVGDLVVAGVVEVSNTFQITGTLTTLNCSINIATVNFTVTGCLTATGGILQLPNASTFVVSQKISCPTDSIMFDSVYVGENKINCPKYNYVQTQSTFPELHVIDSCTLEGSKSVAGVIIGVTVAILVLGAGASILVYVLRQIEFKKEMDKFVVNSREKTSAIN